MTAGPENAHDWAAHDLNEAIERGLEQGGHLLTAGEMCVATQIRCLRGEAQATYARLMSRKPFAFPLDTLVVPGVQALPEALTDLEQRGLVDRFVPWTWRVEAATRTRLADGCRRLGLPVSGPRGVLQERLAHERGWDPSPWIRPRHRHLVRRLQRWATLSAWPAEHHAILERMGHMRFVDYPLTTGAIHPSRARLLAWERVHAALTIEQITVDEALEALGHPHPPRGLDLRGHLVHHLTNEARSLERNAPESALVLYQRMTVSGVALRRVAFRMSRCLEALGRPEEALQTLLTARQTANRQQRLALARAGRRLARSMKRGFPPEAPHHPLCIRRLRLDQVGSSSRPLWTEAAVTVEQAIVTWLADAGRTAVHVEGRVWRSLFALVFADAYFCDVPGTLPVPRMTGPLDLRAPSFRALRPLVDERLLGVLRGDAASIVSRAWTTYGDAQVSGLHPDFSVELLVAVAEQTPPTALHAILETLLVGSSAGLPDLVVLDGPAVALDAQPTRLPRGLRLVEVKGPGDSLSDAQRVWIDTLTEHGLPVEVFDVEAR